MEKPYVVFGHCKTVNNKIPSRPSRPINTSTRVLCFAHLAIRLRLPRPLPPIPKRTKCQLKNSSYQISPITFPSLIPRSSVKRKQLTSASTSSKLFSPRFSQPCWPARRMKFLCVQHSTLLVNTHLALSMHNSEMNKLLDYCSSASTLHGEMRDKRLSCVW